MREGMAVGRRDSLHTGRMNKQVNLRKPMGATFLFMKEGSTIYRKEEN